MNKKIQIVFIASNIILGISVLCVLYCCFILPKTVYVEGETVFESFNMFKEMKKSGETELNQRINKVDSLYKLLNTPERQGDEQLVRVFIEEKNQLELFQNEFVSIESEKIRKRISAYAKEFAEEKGYEFVLSRLPNENILYGKEDKNVTDEFIKYINKKYEGFN